MLIHFHDLSGTQNLTVAVLIHCDRYQNSYIFKLSAPVTTQVDLIYIDIRIASALQRTIAPILNMDICFLVQITDGGGKDLAAPEDLGDFLHTPDGYDCQVHLGEGLFHAAFPTTIPLNNSRLEIDPIGFGDLEGYISGGGGEIAVIVAAAIALLVLIALVPGRLVQLLRLGLQQLVEGFLLRCSVQVPELAIDNFLVWLYNLLGHGLLFPFECLCRDFILPEFCKPCFLFFEFSPTSTYSTP